MRLFTFFCFGGLFFLSQIGFSQELVQHEMSHMESVTINSHFGTAGFSVTDPGLWYSVTTQSFPVVTPLSLGRNKGFSEGRVYLSPTGFTLGEAGNYWVEISAVLQNPGETPLLIPIFLALNEEIVPDGNEQIGGVVILDDTFLVSVHGAGILKNMAEGTRLSIVATNGGYPDPQPITVAGWAISLYKIN